MCILVLLPALVCLAGSVSAANAEVREHFAPAHRLPGIGVGRSGLSDDVLASRTRRMMDSQTFAILRDPRAVAGAQRIFSPRLQRIFSRASSASGLPSDLIAAVAYLESFGDPRAQSPSGPRGIMQIAAGTARRMGLRIVYGKRYRLQTRTRRVRTRQGKWITRRVRVRVRYTVLLRDDRMVPERAIPAAAKYLAGLSRKFDGRDWAVFAYHCGEGCAARMRALTEEADGIHPPYTVAKMFFGASPAVNRDLYLAIGRQMKRDHSPTYWFRVMRARQLLALYRKDQRSFRKLVAGFRYAAAPKQRAPHRLAVWLKGNGPTFRTCDDPESEESRNVAEAFNEPGFYGFRLHGAGAGRGRCFVASPSALGTLAYVAFETRRLHRAMAVKGERFVPLDVTFLAKPLSAPPSDQAGSASILHSTGHVFDIDYGKLPPGEREAFEFVLNDLGWGGHLGFIRAANRHTLHIGCSPSSRDFFDEVFTDAFRKSEEKAGAPSDLSQTHREAWRELARFHTGLKLLDHRREA